VQVQLDFLFIPKFTNKATMNKFPTFHTLQAKRRSGNPFQTERKSSPRRCVQVDHSNVDIQHCVWIVHKEGRVFASITSVDPNMLQRRSFAPAAKNLGGIRRIYETHRR
jgi:hypothetical protein